MNEGTIGPTHRHTHTHTARETDIGPTHTARETDEYSHKSNHKQLCVRQEKMSDGSIDNINGSIDNINGSIDNINGSIDDINGSIDNINGSIDKEIYARASWTV